MQDRGIDLGQPGLLKARSWRWLRVRILGLLALPPSFTPDGRPVPTTRLGFALYPPEAPRKGG